MKYELEYKKRKSIEIKVKDNKVYVTAPLKTDIEVIEKLLCEKRNWIESAFLKLDNRKVLKNTKDEIWYLGKIYKVKKYYIKNLKKPVLKFEKNSFELLISKNLKFDIIKVTDEYYKKVAEKYIKDKAFELSKEMKMSYNNINIKNQKTRFGSCSSKKNLNFNLKLMKAPKHIIDYVIIHELCHLKHFDHSKQFWESVEIYDLNYKANRAWLKENIIID